MQTRMGIGYLRNIGRWQQQRKVNTSIPSSFPSAHQLRNVRNSEISRPANLLSLRSFSSSSRPSKNGLLGWYLGMLETRPIITKSITTSLIYAAADWTSQKMMLPSSDSVDLIRTFRMIGFGLLILGPSQHLWFNFVGKILPRRDVITTIKKLLIGQAIFGPCINSVFFSFNAALQGESGGEIVARLKRDLLRTQLNGLMYWPFCDFITFRFVPVHMQPLMNSSCSYLWTIYLTYMASLKKVGSD